MLHQPNGPEVSVVVITHDRPAALEETLRGLRRQTGLPGGYEIVVVDDGSSPPVQVPPGADPPVRLVRLEGRERSAARNAGAREARGRHLVFVDDDMSVEDGFLAAHLRAGREHPGALVAGAIRLPRAALETPFGRFRQRLEDASRPSGPPAPNYCAAGNMSIPREVFGELGGFDEGLVSGEDQDLALRHHARGGPAVYAADAVAVHRDDALDIASYSRRTEWGAVHVVAFCERHPEWPDNVERRRTNGPPAPGREPFRLTAAKAAKLVLARRPFLDVLAAVTRFLERTAPDGALLDRCYRARLGLALFRGFRRGAGARGPSA
jgi:GT2 family glycosyltransferase